MIIDCISDLHGHYPKLEGGDLLIVAGDLTAKDTLDEYEDALHWMWEQQYRKKIFIAGNHDNKLRDYLSTVPGYLCCELEYLFDSGTEFEGFKIWGSPRTPIFRGVNPKCKAFMHKEKILAEYFSLIPSDTDILITHGPPFTILDLTINHEQVGSTALMTHFIDGKFHPKLWVFGHIHESYGRQNYKFQLTNRPDVICVNASHVNEWYKPVNKPIRVILEDKDERM